MGTAMARVGETQRALRTSLELCGLKSFERELLHRKHDSTERDLFLRIRTAADAIVEYTTAHGERDSQAAALAIAATVALAAVDDLIAENYYRAQNPEPMPGVYRRTGIARGEGPESER